MALMRCMTSAIAGLKAHQNAMDVVGNNISNVNTDAFKSSSSSFRDTLYQTLSDGNSNNAESGVGGTNPSQIGYGATMSSVNVDMSKGGQNMTNKSTDCCIDGDGFFVVSDGGKVADSKATVPYEYNGDQLYTRIGKMQFVDGYLTDGNGHYVLQSLKQTDGSYKFAAIRYEPKDTSKSPVTDNSITNLVIGKDGKVTWNENGKPKFSATDTPPTIAIATFSTPEGLKEMGDGYYNVSANSGAPKYSTPGVGEAGALVTGAVEGSNVDLATEFSNMIIFERGYQANTKIISVADEMLQTLVNMK